MYTIVKQILYITTVMVTSELAYFLFNRNAPVPRDTDKVLFFRELDDLLCRKHINMKVVCNREKCYYRNLKFLVECLDSAQKSLDLAMYLMTSNDLTAAILQAKNRGVKVRIITDFEMSYTSGSKMYQLMEKGVDIKFKDTYLLMHHKFCVVDGGQRNGFVLTGSLNWTMQGIAGNWDNVLYRENSEFVGKYISEFEFIWKEC